MSRETVARRYREATKELYESLNFIRSAAAFLGAVNTACNGNRRVVNYATRNNALMDTDVYELLRSLTTD